jgi:hypothetical protein
MSESARCTFSTAVPLRQRAFGVFASGVAASVGRSSAGVAAIGACGINDAAATAPASAQRLNDRKEDFMVVGLTPGVRFLLPGL